MIDYYLAIILIISIFLFGLMSYFRPFIGVIGFVIWIIVLLPIALDPTVILGTGFNSTSGQSYLITQSVPELRALSIVSVIVSLACTAGGALNNLD